MKMDITELQEKIKEYKSIGNKTVELNIDMVLNLIENNIKANNEIEIAKEYIAILTAQKINLVDYLKKIKIPDKLIKKILKESIKEKKWKRI